MLKNTFFTKSRSKAPDFTKIKPPINAADYLIDCNEFKSRFSLEAAIKTCFFEKGAVILINTGLKDLTHLKQWGSILIDNFMEYAGGNGPRKQLADSVYSVDGEPSSIYVHHHHEMSYLPHIPQCIVFGCTSIPNQGGETIIADNSAVTDELLKTELGQKLKEKGISYIRNLSDANKVTKTVHKTWQETFFLDSRQQMEDFAQHEAWTLKWKEDGLQISYFAEAFEYNETLKKNMLMTSLCHHGMYFDEWLPFSKLAIEKRPFHMTYGDGEDFSDQEIDYFVRIFDNYSLPIFWQPGWVAIINNERWTHARPPYILKKNETRTIGLLLGNIKKRLGAKFYKL